MSREDGTRTHKEVRQGVMADVVRMLEAGLGTTKYAASNEGRSAMTMERVTAKDPEPGHVATIRVQDLEQPAPPKGERPWHVYRVMVVEEKL